VIELLLDNIIFHPLLAGVDHDMKTVCGIFFGSISCNVFEPGAG
jgi:hypothetical protein